MSDLTSFLFNTYFFIVQLSSQAAVENSWGGSRAEQTRQEAIRQHLRRSWILGGWLPDSPSGGQAQASGGGWEHPYLICPSLTLPSLTRGAHRAEDPPNHRHLSPTGDFRTFQRARVSLWASHMAARVTQVLGELDPILGPGQPWAQRPASQFQPRSPTAAAWTWASPGL